MPGKLYSRHCDRCGKYYIGYGRYYCSYKCSKEYPRTETTKKKMSEAMRKRRLTDEHKRKISQSHFALPKIPIKVRFWSKVNIPDLFSCWEWIGHRDSRGYGQITVDGKSWTSSRFSYFLSYGEIPKGLYVCHHCDNPACVNPAHLFLGTQKDNVQDMINKGRAPNQKGEKSSQAKFTDKEIIVLRVLYQVGVSQKELQLMYNVSHATINNIVHRKTWKHI